MRASSWIAGAACLVCSLCLFAATDVAPGIHLVPGATVAGSQPDGNSILIEAPQGLIVVDSGRHREHTQRVIDFARDKGQPVRAIINSHWHLDHVGGNVLIRTRFPDVSVYASPAIHDALGGFLANYRKQLETALSRSESDPKAAGSLRAEIALIDAGPQLAPTHVLTESGSRVIAGRPLELHLERSAVTAGDIWIYDPKTRVLVAGDLVTLPAPFFDTACPSRWQEALAHLASKPFEVLIPGHGAPMRAAAFETYRTAFAHLLTCSADAKRSNGECIGGWMRDADKLLPADDRAYARSLLEYYVSNVLRGEPAKLAELCRAWGSLAASCPPAAARHHDHSPGSQCLYPRRTGGAGHGLSTACLRHCRP